MSFRDKVALMRSITNKKAEMVIDGICIGILISCAIVQLSYR